jgi:chlorobactene glucosyltransferase
MITLFHLAIVATLLLSLGSALWNLSCFDRLVPARPPEEAERLSILIPARNEAPNIERCLRSLVGQDWPNLEIIVLDDRSEDGTGELARKFASDRVSVIDGAELPAGWVGKNWACHQLAQQATGTWLLFLDADTAHEPGFVAALMAHAAKTRADLLSAWPRLEMHTLGERLIIPIIVLFGMVMYPHAFVIGLQRRKDLAARIPRRLLRALGAANGQCLLFRRATYERIGGHAARSDHLVEDVAFGRAIAERIGEGMRLVNCDGTRFSRCRMYRSFGETWRGFTKNARAAFEGNVVAFLFFGSVMFWVFVWPFLALLWPATPKTLVLPAIGLIYLIRFLLAARFRTSWVGAWLHPFGLMLALAIGLNSWLRSSFGGVDWKGRRYKMVPAHPRSSGEP